MVRPAPRFAQDELVRILPGAKSGVGEVRRVWYHFGHRLRMPDGTLEYIYDVRPPHVDRRNLPADASIGAHSIPERYLTRA